MLRYRVCDAGESTESHLEVIGHVGSLKVRGMTWKRVQTQGIEIVDSWSKKGMNGKLLQGKTGSRAESHIVEKVETMQNSSWTVGG